MLCAVLSPPPPLTFSYGMQQVDDHGMVGGEFQVLSNRPPRFTEREMVVAAESVNEVHSFSS